jgi:hypothetical protein
MPQVPRAARSAAQWRVSLDGRCCECKDMLFPCQGLQSSEMLDAAATLFVWSPVCLLSIAVVQHHSILADAKHAN